MWIGYAEWGRGGKVENEDQLRVLPEIESPELGNRRHLLAWLPASYGASEGAYPVVYMHDGQNLFDASTSHAGSWDIGAAMARERIEAIVIGIPNKGAARMEEYSPFRDRRHGGGRGDAYLRFLAETVKPEIDAEFRTRTGPAHTALAGSSMGGLISLYGRLALPGVFGLAAALSPSLRYADEGIFRFARKASRSPGRIYLDVGTREASHLGRSRVASAIRSRRHARAVRRMRDLLVGLGYRPGRDLLHVEAKGDRHHESAWGRRLPAALRFLLSASDDASPTRSSASPSPPGR